MAEGRVTITGPDTFKAGVERLPAAVTLALRAVAFRKSREVYAGAKGRLETLFHGTGETARHLRVVEDAGRQMFVIDVGPMPGRPANLPLWLERGTVKMRARPFLRPSLEAVNDSYIRESDEAVQRAWAEALE